MFIFLSKLKKKKKKKKLKKKKKESTVFAVSTYQVFKNKAPVIISEVGVETTAIMVGTTYIMDQ